MDILDGKARLSVDWKEVTNTQAAEFRSRMIVTKIIALKDPLLPVFCVFF